LAHAHIARKLRTTDNLIFRIGLGTTFKNITSLSINSVDPFNSGWTVTNGGYANMVYLSDKGPIPLKKAQAAAVTLEVKPKKTLKV